MGHYDPTAHQREPVRGSVHVSWLQMEPWDESVVTLSASGRILDPRFLTDLSHPRFSMQSTHFHITSRQVLPLPLSAGNVWTWNSLFVEINVDSICRGVGEFNGSLSSTRGRTCSPSWSALRWSTESLEHCWTAMFSKTPTKLECPL